MKNKKVLLRLLKLLLLLALVVLIPMAGAGALYGMQENAYEETYYAALPLKTERLRETDGRRVVVIGGSSVAFGIDSKLIEEELGIPCVNFGLYAAFGLKPMLDLSLKDLHKGDIVIVAPEITSQMYSSYCGYDYLLEAFETEPGALVGLGTDYYMGLMSQIPGYIRDAKALRQKGGAPVDGVYALSSFDAYGDLIYPRPENIMDLGYSRDNLPEINAGIVTADFLDMINAYTRSARRKGAEVYFSFCPVNALSVSGEDAKAREDFTEALKNGLDCPILSPLNGHIMDAGFFYDSNYHLNDTGVRMNSLLLVSDVQRLLGTMRKTTAALPNPPVLQRDNAVLASGTENGFIYEVTARGAAVTGLERDIASQSSLTVPSVLGGAPVISVSEGVFSGCSAVEITLPLSVTRLPSRLFAGAENLKTVYLPSPDLPEVGENLLAEAAPGIIIRVPPELYSTYITDYFWGAYTENLGEIE